jgi:hypothetical protein
MKTRTKDPKVHARTILLPAAVDTALVKAAKKDGRPVRLYAARLLAAALGIACLILAGCSGDASGPLVTSERHDDAGAVDDSGSATDSADGATSCDAACLYMCAGKGVACAQACGGGC